MFYKIIYKKKNKILIYKYYIKGFPTDTFPVLFTIPRMAGWIAHWYEYADDKENKIIRPR